MRKILKELKSKRCKKENLKKKHRSQETLKPQLRGPNHGRGCKCTKCRKWHIYLKGKHIHGKTSRFHLPQFDGNDSDTEFGPEPRQGQLAHPSNEVTSEERASTFAQSQQPFFEISPSCEASGSRVSGHYKPSKMDYQTIANPANNSNSRVSKRPAKLAAKALMKKVYDFFEDARQNSGDLLDSDESQSEYDYQSEDDSSIDNDEDTDDVEEEEEEEFHSAHSPNMILEANPERQVPRLQQSRKLAKKRTLPTIKSDNEDSNDQDSDSQHPPLHSVNSDPDTTKICHIESFDLDVNSTRVDQLNIPATFQQAPEHYLRFLSKFVYIC